MQRWSKYQFQSRILERKILFLIFTTMIIGFSPHAIGQEELGKLVEEQKIVFEIGRDSSVHVKHIIEFGKWNPDAPRIVKILSGPHSNLTVYDEDGDRMGHTFDGETFEESEYVIVQQKFGCCDVFVEYDLDNFLEKNNGIWKKEIKFPFDVLVMLDDDIELIFVNSRPVDVSEAKGVNCVGCNLILEFFDSEKMQIEKVLYNEKEFVIDIKSNGNISNMEYVSGGNQLLNFNVKNLDQLTVLKIPFELVLNPFDVYFTEEEDSSLEQLDKIRKTEFGQDETHAYVSFRTNAEGVISIVGASQEDYQKKLAQINEQKLAAKPAQIIEEEKGIAVPIPQMNDGQEVQIEDSGKLSFEDELLKKQQEESDNTIIIIIAGIIAAIIIVILIKIKKN